MIKIHLKILMYEGIKYLSKVLAISSNQNKLRDLLEGMVLCVSQPYNLF